jgi:hypothetical protein
MKPLKIRPKPILKKTIAIWYGEITLEGLQENT